MRATLTFNLPEETEEFFDMLNGGHYRSALYSIDMWLRSLSKYEGKVSVKVEQVRARIREDLEDLPL